MMRPTLKTFLTSIALTLLLCSNAVVAQISVPKIFTSNMVLQRDMPLKIWGKAGKNESVKVTFNSQEKSAKADSKGNWEISLNPMTWGGPFQLKVIGKNNQLIFDNVMIGDVWFCSGQSNMEMPVGGWGKINNFEKEIADANHPNIRFFTVEKAMSFSPEKDLKGGQWDVCSPSTLEAFSSTAYFFGRKLNNELGIPIGLINSSWGGTNIQTWISNDAISKVEGYENFSADEAKKKVEQWKKNRQKYDAALLNDPGTKEKWNLPQFNDTNWNKIELPQIFEQSKLGNIDGMIWFRKSFQLNTEQLTNQEIVLTLGAIDDYDEVYINGELIGSTNVYYTNRKYTIKPSLLKNGKNTIALKVIDTGGMGGFTGAASDMALIVGNNRIPLSGEWNYRLAVATSQFDVQNAGANDFPSQLFNAMVSPVVNYPIKGAIWYQGEENANYPKGYDVLFPTLINNWREKWGYQFPFIWAQLANYMAPDSVPSESNWSIIREAQHKTLNLPKTGEAVIIDLGDAKDIHPKNKQDVGKRLALNALKVAYNQIVVCSGPSYKSVEFKDGKAVLSFENAGSSLKAKGNKYGYLQGFAIAGADKKLVWAKAYIDGDKVVVFNEGIKDPVAVRYAWGINPDDANLFNTEGLPASPFRTDNW